MLETITTLANLLVEKAPHLLRVALNEEDRSKNYQREAAHFLKFNLDGDERRIGRDFEVYSFMATIAGEETATTYLLVEIVLPLKGHSAEAFKEGVAFLRGRAPVFGDKQQAWLDMLADLEKIIFVFGSNELGLHGGGAARVAREKHGARYERKGGPGQGFGPQGNSFAIPTCSTTTNEHNHAISLEKITFYIDCFLLYATRHPELTFHVTQIGCGLAGWTKEQIAPLFVNAPANCLFDTEWKPFLRPDHQYWGHVG